jgi:type I restriction enzyme S subunit
MDAVNAYPSYRTARMRWLPPVPEHWNEQRAKTFFREVDERSKTGQEELLSVSHLTGVTPRSQKNVTMFKAASYVGSKLCQPGDIVINTLWAWMAALGASRHLGIVSPAYGVYRPHRADSFNPTYLDYLLRTRAYVAEYIGRSTGIRSSRLRLYPNQFLDIALLQPPRPEQDQIVAYLRAQDAHIARFIKAKRELIGLLTEQKLRIIDHAVTRGIDESVALKPSGIAWLGEVPEHWEVLQLRRVTRCLDGARIPLNASERGLRQGNYPYWGANKVIDHLDGWLFDEPLVLLGEDGAPFFDKTKDVAFAVSGKIWVNNHTHVLRPRNRITPHYLAHVLNCVDYTGFIDGSTRDKLTQQSMKSIRIPLPEVSEQIKICKHIASVCAPLKDAIERAEREIALIREYRDRQIADVVTGQVDVRGWVPGPDDGVIEEDLAALGGDEDIEPDGDDDDGDD